MDFLQERKFCVEQGDKVSETKLLDGGCVLGSVLGPRLFSLYVGGLEDHLLSLFPDIKIVSFADDTYVTVQTEAWENLKKKTEEVINQHVNYLRVLGMTVNEDKTEMIVVSNNPQDNIPDHININNKLCAIKKSMKALGIIIDGKLKWDEQEESAISKGRTVVARNGKTPHLRNIKKAQQMALTSGSEKW